MDDAQLALKRQTNWWEASNEFEARERLMAWYEKVRQDDVGRLEMLNRHLRMYGNIPVDESGRATYGVGWMGEDRIRLNVVKAACDTVTSKITKNEPLPFPEVTGGNWSMRTKARFLQQFFEAQFYVSCIPAVGRDVFLDCAITGTGVMKMFVKDKEIKAERVFPGEIFVEELDGLERDPRMIVQRKLVDRNVLSKMFPKHASEILQAGRALDHSGTYGHDTNGDQVLVLEAWRRPGKGDKGCHIIATENSTLLKEAWDMDLPFVFIRWSRRARGFWGQGLAEEITGIQVEINRLLQKIQAAMHLIAVPRVFVEEGSRVLKAYLNNKIGMVVPYRGTKPIYETANSVSPEIFGHLNWLYVKAFEIAGVSLMSPGRDHMPDLSGVALSTFNDIETERFATVIKDWEQLHMDVADLMVTLAKKTGGVFVLKNDRYSIQRVDWKKIDLDRDAFVLRIEPVSSLPSTPAGRLNYVQNMINSGLIDDPKEGRRLLNFSDFSREQELEEAIPLNIARILEKMLDKQEYEAPEPYIDLNLALRMAQDEYNRAIQYDDIPEETLELLRRWMNQVHVMKKAEMAEQQRLQAPPAAGAPMPPGNEGAPPTAV